MSAATGIDIAPRLELLRTLAGYRDFCEAHGDPHLPRYTPLFGACEWPFSEGDMVLACKEAAAIGQIEAHRAPLEGDGTFIYGYMMRITDAGYAHIRAHDLLGEEAQEARNAGQ